MKTLTLILITLLLTTTTQAQELQPENDTPTTQLTQTDPKNTTQINLIICNTNPTKYIILDQNGTWKPNIWTIQINTTPNTPPTITCTEYQGPYKPEKPQQKTWPLKAITTIPETEFNQTITKLQNNPQYQP